MHDQVLGAVVAGDPRCPVDLGPVTLAVVEGEGQRRPPGPLDGEGHAHRRVEAARQDDQLPVHGPWPSPAVSSTEESVVSHGRSFTTGQHRSLEQLPWASSSRRRVVEQLVEIAMVESVEHLAPDHASDVLEVDDDPVVVESVRRRSHRDGRSVRGGSGTDPCARRADGPPRSCSVHVTLVVGEATKRR